MNEKRMKQELVEGTEWSVDYYGMLICPCGHKIEDDGQCPNGHTSIMRQKGLI